MMIKELKNLFDRPSSHVLIAQELEEAKASLLSAMTGKDYACAMVEYHCSRIDRLKSMLDLEEREL